MPAGTLPQAAPALKSIQLFGGHWARLDIEQQLAQALASAPENAGPLSSHRLVLRALERMRDLRRTTCIASLPTRMPCAGWRMRNAGWRQRRRRRANASGRRRHVPALRPHAELTWR